MFPSSIVRTQLIFLVDRSTAVIIIKASRVISDLEHGDVKGDGDGSVEG